MTLLIVSTRKILLANSIIINNYYCFTVLSASTSDEKIESADKLNDSVTSAHEIDWNNLRWEWAVGKRRDCAKLVYTTDERQLYGKNRDLLSGESAYLCRLYHNKKCKSRLYMKNGRLFKKDDFVEHNHPPQDFDHNEFKIEKAIKNECGNLDVLVNARTQSSAVAEIFDRHMKQYVL